MQFNVRGGRFNYAPSTTGTPFIPTGDKLLLEDDDDILLEDDGAILLEGLG